MYSFFLDNSLYLVLIIFLIGLAGILAVLMRMGGRLSMLEKKGK